MLDLETARNLDVLDNEKYKSGKFSKITFLKLDQGNKIKINNKININIGNVIVKKKYQINIIDDESQYILDKFGSIKNFFYNEIKCLECLFGLKHFPLLLCIDNENLEIYMSYCGTNLNENNIPKNWKKQIDSIIKSLNESNIYNNDFWINNLLVHRKILYMIDFGFSSFYEEDFPFVNISSDDLNNYSDLILLLDNALLNSVEKRLFFSI